MKALGIDVVAVEPGAFPTYVFNDAQFANGASRSNGYGAVAQMPQKMGEVLGQLFGSSQAPNPKDVADAILDLVKMPADTRSMRVIVGNLNGGPVKAMNEECFRHRQGILAAFGLA